MAQSNEAHWDKSRDATLYCRYIPRVATCINADPLNLALRRARAGARACGRHAEFTVDGAEFLRRSLEAPSYRISETTLSAHRVFNLPSIAVGPDPTRRPPVPGVPRK